MHLGGAKAVLNAHLLLVGCRQLPTQERGPGAAGPFGAVYLHSVVLLPALGLAWLIAGGWLAQVARKL